MSRKFSKLPLTLVSISLPFSCTWVVNFRDAYRAFDSFDTAEESAGGEGEIEM